MRLTAIKRLLLLGKRGGALVLPVTIGLRLDLDSRLGLFADTGGTTPAAANGEAIALWQDQSGGGRHFSQSTASIRPTLLLSALNGYPAINFDGVDDYLPATALLSSVIANNAYSMYMVFAVDAVDTNNSNTYQNDIVIADSTSYFGTHLKSTPPSAFAFNWDGTDDSTSAALTIGAYTIIHQRHASGNLFISANGGTEASTASGNTQILTGTLQLGRAAGGLYAFDGKIIRILIYNVAHSSTDRDSILAYLSALYAIPLG